LKERAEATSVESRQTGRSWLRKTDHGRCEISRAGRRSP
jgi:hypothetical protein